MKIYEILQEAVGGNYLYHGVPDGRTLTQILQSGALQPMPPFDFDNEGGDDNPDSDRISLTRNQYLHFPYGYGVAQIVIDKDALRKAGYKVVPAVGAMIHYKGETEERVFKPIPMRSPFVVEIQYDPKLKVPKTFLARAQEAGIRLSPWRKTSKNYDKPKQDKTIYYQDDFTDPSKVAISRWHDRNPNLFVSYKKGSFTTRLSPESTDENYIKDLFVKIRDRVAQGLTWDDLLPQSQYGKTWSQGYYEIPHGSPKWKEPTK
jgi:hypothetical protein